MRIRDLHKYKRLTKRALDGGYAPRYFGMFLALAVFRFDGESTLPPTASNAHRWALRSRIQWAVKPTD